MVMLRQVLTHKRIGATVQASIKEDTVPSGPPAVSDLPTVILATCTLLVSRDDLFCSASNPRAKVCVGNPGRVPSNLRLITGTIPKAEVASHGI